MPPRSRSALSPLHRVWRALPARARRRALSRGAALLAPRAAWPPPPVRDGVLVGGELGRASGLGEGARLMLAGLDALGVANWSMEAGLALAADRADVPGPRSRDGAVPAGAALVLHVNAPLLPAALLRLPRALPRGRRIIGYWAWELPTLPPDWRAGRALVHEVWVPSRFTADAVETLLPGRVRVVPHPVAARPPRPSPLDRAAFGLPWGAVVTLVSFSLASSLARKNPLGAIAAHRAAFGDRPDRLLVLKLAHAHHAPDDLATLRAAAAGTANIRVLDQTLPAADSHALTAAADIVLSLHRSEGFGLVPAEAMLLARPVVATGWSGNLDFMDDGCACLVPCRLVPARDPRGVFEAPGAVWADPDIAAAAAALTRLADDAALRDAIGARARAAAQHRLGTDGLAAAVRTLGLAPS